MNILSIYMHTCPVTKVVTSTAQTDLGLRYRTFSQKMNLLITFSEITQAWQC